MANVTIKRVANLDAKLVLAPERYDQRRNVLGQTGGEPSTVTLGQLAEVVRQTFNPTSKGAAERRFVVLDTSDVREGLIIGRKPVVLGSDIGSAKKVFTCNDVLISRLRPYLRQVAIADEGFALSADGAELACSTEFYVLRSKSASRIDFLIPYLLSDSIQMALAASQEGGHHPRFDEAVLLGLPVPAALLRQREPSTNAITVAAERYRESEMLVQSHISKANLAMQEA